MLGGDGGGDGGRGPSEYLAKVAVAASCWRRALALALVPAFLSARARLTASTLLSASSASANLSSTCLLRGSLISTNAQLDEPCPDGPAPSSGDLG